MSLTSLELNPFQNMESSPIQKFIASPKMLERLSELGESRTFQKNEVLLNEHAFIRSIPIVTKGTIKIIQTDDDYREILLYYIHPGETCVMSFFEGIHSEKSKIKAVAEEESEVLLIPIRKAAQLVKEFPEWIEYIFFIYHRRFENLLEIVNELSFKKMDTRLLQLLKRKSEAIGSKELVITHEQVANEMGTSRVVISRLLKQMEYEKLIKLGRNKIVLM